MYVHRIMVGLFSGVIKLTHFRSRSYHMQRISRGARTAAFHRSLKDHSPRAWLPPHQRDLQRAKTSTHFAEQYILRGSARAREQQVIGGAEDFKRL